MSAKQIKDVDGSLVWVAGEGQHSHEVPVECGRVVRMLDGSHKGTEIYRTSEGFRFVLLDEGQYGWVKTYTTERCILVRMRDVDANEVIAAVEVAGCDLDNPDGLALLGLGRDDSTDGLGEVLWDSEVAQ